MTVSAEEWERLATRFDEEARRDPDRYRRKVGRFVTLGYAVVGAWVLLLLALVAGLVAVAAGLPILLIKLGWPLLILVFVLVRSLWIRIEPPPGVRIRRKDAPALFDTIDELNGRVRGPKVHEVVVDGEFNAAVVQRPRPGLVFGSRNSLVLGLPYLQAATPEEVRSTVAHELAHLSSNHGRLGTRLYRVEMTWWKLLQQLEEKRRFGTGLARRFLSWYLPRLDARAFPLKRAQEREADRLASDAAGKEATASSLAALAIAAPWVASEYWPSLFDRVRREQAPPASAFTELGREVGRAFTDDEARARFDAELAREALPHETHPALRERLELSGVDPDTAFALATRRREGPTAAQALLGPLEARLTEDLDRQWRESVADAWREEHRAATEAEQELERLERADGTLDEDGVRVRARLAETFRSSDEAFARWQEVLERSPDDEEAHLATGVHLLSRDDDEGLRHLEVASRSLDPGLGQAAFVHAISWLDEHGRTGEADAWRTRLERYVEVGEESGTERSRVTQDDRFSAPELEAEAVDRLRAVLAGHNDVGRAWLARKHVEHFDDEAPLHVLLVEPRKKLRTFWRELDAEDKDESTLADRIATEVAELPHDVMVVTTAPRAAWARRIEEAGEPVYDRSARAAVT